MRFRALTVLLLSLLLGTTAYASVMAVGPGAFPTGAPVLTFNGLTDGTEVNGLMNSGVQFSYQIGGIPVNGAVIIDGGPGLTNNISPPNIVSVGNNTGTLILTLPGTFTLFGYGFAILDVGPVSNATTISLFNGTTAVGSLSYPGNSDPNFTGGFAGIESTIAFNRVALTFNSAVASAFAADNVTFATVANVPEPATVLLAIAGVLFCCFSKGLSVLVRRNRPVRQV